MLNSVLYFGRQNCKYSKLLEKYLKNNSRKFVSVKSKYKGEIIKKNQLQKIILIIFFVSEVILFKKKHSR